MMINTFDIDGVILFDDICGGIHPGPRDLIITGRSIGEALETLIELKARGIQNQVFFNPKPYHEKTRTTSGEHKAHVLGLLMKSGYSIGAHFEDDPLQIKIIKDSHPNLNVVYVNSNLTELENKRRK